MKDDARIAAEYEALKVEHSRVVGGSSARIAELEAELSMARHLLAGGSNEGWAQGSAVPDQGIAELQAAARVVQSDAGDQGSGGAHNPVESGSSPEPATKPKRKHTKLKGAKE